MNHRGCIWRHR